MYCLVLIIIMIHPILFSRANDVEVEPRIVGGLSANIEEYPHQVSLENNGKHHCGGSLIMSNIVLTAAHCETLKEDTVRAGSSFKEAGGQIAEVVDVCDHPNYNETETNYDYDVSVIKLNQSFQLGPGVQLIDLQPVGVEVPVGTQATVTGWGQLSYKGFLPTILHKAVVPKSTNELCENNRKFFEITDRMTCYGSEVGGKDACQLDSGGPLIVGNKQVGIVSWGFYCAFPKFPGVYTRIENENIQNHINHCIEKFTN